MILVDLLAGFAALIASAGPAFALDKVTFGLNWLATPQLGGSTRPSSTAPTPNMGSTSRSSRAVHSRTAGCFCSPASSTSLRAGPARQFPRRGAQPPACRGGGGVPERPADFHVASGRRAGQMDRSSERLAGLRQRRRPVFLLRLDGEAVGI